MLREVSPELARYSHGAVVCGQSMMLIFGGYDKDGLKRNDVISYHTQKNVLEVVETSGIPPSPRTGHSIAVHGNVMICFGGSLRLACADTNDVHYLSIGTWVWRTKMAEAVAYAMVGNAHRRDDGEDVVVAKEPSRSHCTQRTYILLVLLSNVCGSIE